MTRPVGSTPTAPSRGFTATTGRSAKCPHLDARQMFLDIDDPHAGRRRTIRTPFLTDTYDESRTDSAPQLGAHNDELLPKVSPTTA